MALMDVLASELDLSCPLDCSRLKEVVLRALFKSHLNPESHEICRLRFVPLVRNGFPESLPDW